MEYTQDERLAVLTAMQKQIKPALDEAKAIARQEIMEGFAETHTDRRAIIVGEEKVGEIGISYSKAAPVILKERMDEAVAFLDSIGMVDIVPKKGWEAHFAKAGDKVVCTTRARRSTGPCGAPSRQRPQRCAAAPPRTSCRRSARASRE